MAPINTYTLAVGQWPSLDAFNERGGLVSRTASIKLKSSGAITGRIKGDENIEKTDFSEKRRNTDSFQSFLDGLDAPV